MRPHSRAHERYVDWDVLLDKYKQLIDPNATRKSIQDHIEYCDLEKDKVIGVLNQMNWNGLTRGDYIQTIAENDRYRNSGTYVFDGEKVIHLDYESYDYGVPPFNVISEFPIRYWQDVHSHGPFVFADLSDYKSTIQVQNVETTEYEDLQIKLTFEANAHKYTLVITHYLDQVNVGEQAEVTDELVNQLVGKCFNGRHLFSYLNENIDEPDGTYDPDFTLFAEGV